MMNECLKNEVAEVNVEAETVKTIKVEDITEILNQMKGSIIIRWGNFCENTYESKFMFDFKAVIQKDGQILITGKGFNDYEDIIDEVFIIDSNDVFDAYYEDDGYEKNIRINLFECGEFIDVEEQI